MSVRTSSSGSKTFFTTTNTFEKKFGYHRAIRKGPFIYVSGTTALDPQSGIIEHANDAKLQAMVAMKRTVEAIEKLGGKLEDVIRVKMFVARHEDCLDIGEAFRECFGGNDEGEIGCTATMIVVKDGFVDHDMLVEVEVDAIV